MLLPSASLVASIAPLLLGATLEGEFEVLEGLKSGDRVITGPFANVRELVDGQEVRLQEQDRNRARTTTSAAQAQ